ncbi:MAG: hypothetical protein FWD39_02305 [Clostridiales bacterium]|nr:hypothetical protein [Clostridiales bacterium]
MVWAVVSTLILLILILGILTIGQANLMRSVDEASKRQAYLTARSTVESIIRLLQTEDNPIQALLDEAEEDGRLVTEIALDGLTFWGSPMPIAGEILSASMTRTGEKDWRLTVTALYNDYEETVTVHLKNEVTIIEEEIINETHNFKMCEIFHGVFINNVTMGNNTELTIDYTQHPDSHAYLMNIVPANNTRRINMNYGILNSKHIRDDVTGVLSGNGLLPPGTRVFLENGAAFNSMPAAAPEIFAPNQGFDATRSTPPGRFQTYGGNMASNIVSGTAANWSYNYVSTTANNDQVINTNNYDYAFIFIFLMDNNSSVTISGNNPRVKIYVHGTLQNAVTITNGTEIWGSIVCNQVIMANNARATIHFERPSEDILPEAYFGDPRNVSLGTTTTRTVDWGFVKFE